MCPKFFDGVENVTYGFVRHEAGGTSERAAGCDMREGGLGAKECDGLRRFEVQANGKDFAKNVAQPRRGEGTRTPFGDSIEELDVTACVEEVCAGFGFNFANALRDFGTNIEEIDDIVIDAINFAPAIGEGFQNRLGFTSFGGGFLRRLL